MRTTLTLISLCIALATATAAPDAPALYAAWRHALAYTYPTGLIAYYSMDSRSGTTVYDTFGTNDATAVGSPLFDAAYGKYLDGVRFVAASTQYLTVPGNGNFNFSNNFTVSMWVNMVSYDRAFVVARGAYQEDGFMLSQETTSNGALRTWVNRAGQRNYATWENIFQTTAGWQHIVWGYDDGVLYLYLDGVNQGAPDASGYGFVGDFLYSSSRAISIGSIGGNWCASCYADEIAIFNRVLTTIEITGLYNAGAGRFYTP